MARLGEIILNNLSKIWFVLDDDDTCHFAQWYGSLESTGGRRRDNSVTKLKRGPHAWEMSALPDQRPLSEVR
jgi:hypothetical protein